MTNPKNQQQAPQQATWRFDGTPEALEALCKRDQAQAEALAHAMRTLSQRKHGGSNYGQVRALQRKLKQLKRKLHKKGGRKRRGKRDSQHRQPSRSRYRPRR